VSWNLNSYAARCRLSLIKAGWSVGADCLPHTCYVCVWCLSAGGTVRLKYTVRVCSVMLPEKENGVGTSTSVVGRMVSDLSKATRRFETSDATRPSMHRANWHSPATLTEVFPCFFLSWRANARVYLTKTGHGPLSF